MSLQQLERIFPAPEDQLKELLSYAETLSETEAAAHFQSLLGDSPEVISFISTFNSRRPGPTDAPGRGTPQPAPQKKNKAQNKGPADVEPVPKSERNAKGKKKKADLHVPEARKVAGFDGGSGTAYNKKDQKMEYIGSSKNPGGRSGSTSRTRTPAEPSGSGQSSVTMTMSDLQAFMNATSAPPTTKNSRSNTPAPGPQKAHASAGYLIGDGPPKKSKSTSKAPVAAKINITGGLPMSGAAAAVSDLDAAIKALEISTNPTKNGGKKCNCVASKHPLQTAAPNCLNCGKVICVKEGLGPCSFCGEALISSEEVQVLVKELVAERGRQRMAVDRESHKKADLSTTPATYASAKGGPMSDAALLARQHRDKLLSFQAENAQRTKVVDEASDFDTRLAQGNLGGSMWSTPLERALELKRQQKRLREMEWEAKPEYEKRTQVLSIDLVGKKVVKKMQTVQRPATPESDGSDIDDEYGVLDAMHGSGGTGKFSKNPLMKGLVRPVFVPEAGHEGPREKTTKWRRVQDDRDDNEDVILDGGAYGGKNT